MINLSYYILKNLIIFIFYNYCMNHHRKFQNGFLIPDKIKNDLKSAFLKLIGIVI